MTNENSNQLIKDKIPSFRLRNSIDQSIEPMRTDWKESQNFVNELITKLEDTTNLSNFEKVNFNYWMPFVDTLPNYPKQAVAIIPIFQIPNIINSNYGFLAPESNIIICKRSTQNNWGADTWSIPMGKLESKDTAPFFMVEYMGAAVPLFSAIQRAGKREVNEETLRTSNVKFETPKVVGSYFDKQTGFLIHTTIMEIAKHSTLWASGISVDLPDEREHQKIGWITIKDLPKLYPMQDGVRFSLITALKHIQELSRKYNNEMV